LLRNSLFYEKNLEINVIISNEYNQIKNDYKSQKNELKRDTIEKLVNFISRLYENGCYDADIEFYILNLIDHYGYNLINKIISNSNDFLYEKFYDFDKLKLFLLESPTLEFIDKNCTQEYYLKNKNINKYRLKSNQNMVDFFEKSKYYNEIIISYLKLNDYQKVKKYIKYYDDKSYFLNRLLEYHNVKDLKYVKLLIKNGAKVSYLENYNIIKWASSQGKLDIIKFLMNDDNELIISNTALLEASKNNHINIIKYIIEEKNTFGLDYQFALLYACKNKNNDIFFYLCKNYVIEDQLENILIYYSYNFDNYEIFKYFYNNYPSYDWNACFLDLCRLYKYKFIKYLIKKGFDIHYKDDIILTYDICSENYNFFIYLLNHGIKFIENYHLFLYNSCKTGNIELLNYIISNNLDIHVENENAMIIAVSDNQIEIVKILIENDFDVNKKELLKMICNQNLIHIFNLFVNNGMIIDSFLFNYACENGNEYIVKYCLNKNVNVGNIDIKNIIINKKFNIVKLLLENKMVIDKLTF
jgi:hypothetical protein